MKVKVIEVILVCLLVFMLGGILTSVKSNDNNDISEITSSFDQTSIYDTSGYVSYDPNEDNTNFIGEINGKIGDGISKGINGVINWFFEMLKKVVS